MSKIPIIIIHRDRPSMLRKCIESVKGLGDVYVVVHDNGTTFPAGVEYLKELEFSGEAIVHRYSGDQNMDSISSRVAETVKKEIARSNCSHYVVTDCDIELCDANPKLLGLYKELLLRFPMVVCVGPMLRIDDLPSNDYVNEQKKSHVEQFWHKTPKVFDFDGDSYSYQDAAIDTTFAMYRSSFVFRRLNVGFRVYYPFWARHLDWYLYPSNPDEERLYYMSHCSDKVSTATRHLKEWGFIK